VEDDERLARRFETQRVRLRAMAYRMLGSQSEAEDALQDAWLRVSRADTSTVDNLDAWLTTVVARVCLNLLRTRRSRREYPLDVCVPDPVITAESAAGPQEQTELASSVGLALLVVLETLSPSERVAFVLHDMFAVPFDDIATLLQRSPAAARQLASRARRRVQGQAPTPDNDVRRQRQIVDAFFAAARDGDFEALVAVLDPDIVLRSDGGPTRTRLTTVLRGPRAVSKQAFTYARLSPFVRPALINGAAGVVVAPQGRPMCVMAFTVANDKIAAIDVLADPERLERLDMSALDR
jgi:RNA polymerase sigma factor (sigma-70 family)